MNPSISKAQLVTSARSHAPLQAASQVPQTLGVGQAQWSEQQMRVILQCDTGQ